eukprot:187170_1
MSTPRFLVCLSHLFVGSPRSLLSHLEDNDVAVERRRIKNGADDLVQIKMNRVLVWTLRQSSWFGILFREPTAFRFHCWSFPGVRLTGKHGNSLSNIVFRKTEFHSLMCSVIRA